MHSAQMFATVAYNLGNSCISLFWHRLGFTVACNGLRQVISKIHTAFLRGTLQQNAVFTSVILA